MAQITIQLDTGSANDLKMLMRLLDSEYGGRTTTVMKPPFPTIQPSAEPDLPRVTPRNEAYEAGVRTLARTTQPSAETGTSDFTFSTPFPAGNSGLREAAVPMPPAPPAPAGQTQELDAAGLPWDARIHSESRARIADNTWRRKRGVDQTVVDSVTAELRAAYPAPTGQPAPASTPPVAETPAAEPPTIPPAGALGYVPPPPPPAPPARGVTDLAAAVARGNIKLDDLNAACLSNGCANVLELNKNPAALAAVCAQFDAIGAFQP